MKFLYMIDLKLRRRGCLPNIVLSYLEGYQGVGDSLGEVWSEAP